MRAGVIINQGAGGAFGDESIQQIRKALAANRIDGIFHVSEGAEDLERQAAGLSERDLDSVIAAGGDGTISIVASQLVGTGRTLGVIPLGTINNFSKDLGIPQDIDGAVAVIANGERREIDVGAVNGRCFINNSSIGLYPRIVRKRIEQQRLGRGKWWAAAWAVWQFFLLSPFVRVRLSLDGNNELRRKTAFVFVGNNDYEMDFYNIGRRLSLDEGNLSIYLLRHGGRWGLFLLVLHTIFGRLRQNKDFEEFRAEELTLQSRRRRQTLVALDGEVALMNYPLEYRIRPKALSVFVPKQDQ